MSTREHSIHEEQPQHATDWKGEARWYQKELEAERVFADHACRIAAWLTVLFIVEAFVGAVVLIAKVVEG